MGLGVAGLLAVTLGAVGTRGCFNVSSARTPLAVLLC